MLNILEKHAKFLAILWLLFISVLFFLPGSALPKAGWLDAIYFDKWVHCGFFALLVFLWRFYFPRELRYNWWLLLLALCYAFGVEVIQYYFIPNRSFDLFDVMADMTGAFAGIWFWTRRYIKK
ncbi:VanZ family protein [Flavisolibacter ginsenosidimutans]|uniref:VanZ family protein n=1 Tax=Flavisolibacter ginsenosidimutans TaxID=661481 RepID=A0A5B8UN27_9BACT|nr:VanZ family protein [Flavisolibacter ginsenosidimutans]QEC57772.1 VanZ family protein [Flavisolibacter ginsenosidimutans]